jgi:hypothetical protein
MPAADHSPAPHFPAEGTVPHLPKFAAVERLTRSLEEGAVTARAANAIAIATADPAAFRRAMQAPVHIHTASGDLTVIYTRVWTPAVVPHPMNVRLSPKLPYSFSGVGRRSLSLSRPVADPSEAAELVVLAPSREVVVSTLTEATMLLANENPMSDDIGIDGVIEPITVVPITFTHDDSSADVTILAAVDGSSRVAGAYRNLDLAPDQVVYSYAMEPSALRSRLGRWLRMANANPADLDENDLRQLNSVTMPAAVVIGYRPNEASRTIASFSRAIDARVGAIHVAPPTPWSRAAQYDAQLNAVLDALEAEGDLTSEEASYYAGDLTPDEALAADLPKEADVRSVALLLGVHRPTHVRTIHEALRGVAIRKPSFKDRAALAAEGALRAFRNEVALPQADAARNLLAHLYTMEEFRSGDWGLYDSDVNAILKAALDDNYDAALSLLSLSIYWIARYGSIRRTTRGGEADRRDISIVLRGLLDNERGLRQLHRIIVDGRAGEPPRRVSTSGKAFVRGPTGKQSIVTEEFLRRTWSSEASSGEDLPAQSPEADLLARFETLRVDVSNLVDDVKSLLGPLGVDGQPVVLRLGLNPEAVDQLLTKWAKEAAGPLSHYRYIADQQG